MYAVKDKVLYNVTGRTLTFEAPQGRPSANGTVVLYDPRYDRTASAATIVSGTATLKSVSTTVTTASGVSSANKRRVTCTPPAAMLVDDWVRLTNALGQSEYVQVAAKSTTYFDVHDDLVYDYTATASDTITSAVMTSPAIPPTFVQSTTNIYDDFYAEWTYTVAGISYTERSRFDIVREIIDFSITDGDLLEVFPDLRRNGPFARQAGTYAPQIRAAQKMVEAECIAEDRDPDRFRGNELLKYLVLVQTGVLLAINGWKPNGIQQAEHIATMTAWFDRVWHRLIHERSRVPYDADGNDAISSTEKTHSIPDLQR